MSDAERADRLAADRPPTAEDIRSLAGPATPHFAQQIAVRINRLIDRLEPDDPVRAEGETQLARLAELSRHSGEPRGRGPRERTDG